jgi:hypothetical protein
MNIRTGNRDAKEKTNEKFTAFSCCELSADDSGREGSSYLRTASTHAKTGPAKILVANDDGSILALVCEVLLQKGLSHTERLSIWF